MTLTVGNLVAQLATIDLASTLRALAGAAGWSSLLEAPPPPHAPSGSTHRLLKMP